MNKKLVRTVLDVDFVRKQFPAFDEPTLGQMAFCENAGGSYACRPVIDRMSEYYRRLKVQPYYAYPASQEAGQWMDNAHAHLARYLNVGADEIHFGPSTSQNMYVLAQAFRDYLSPGDEVVVTNQDHEANSGVWRRLTDFGINVLEWKVDPASGALDPGRLFELVGSRTRLVAFPHCSNIVAQINPVKEICRELQSRGIFSLVDGVSFAPHGFPDVADLGCDAYLFSLYKTYGPHQGLMAIRPRLMNELGNQGHYFNHALGRKRLVPAGPDHAQIAAASGVAEYFDALDEHHGGADDIDRPARVRNLLHHHDETLLQPLLAWVATSRNLQLIGSGDPTTRSATLAFVTQKEPARLVSALAAESVMAAAGHFYSVRLLDALGIAPSRGVLRLSLAHYNSEQDVVRTITALKRVT